MRTNIIFVHGINDQGTGYSDVLFDRICSAARDRGVDPDQLQQCEVIWADVTRMVSQRYLQLQYPPKRKGLWHGLEADVDPLAIQVLNYQKDKKNGAHILSRVDEQVAPFTEGCDNVIIVAHSLGSVIMFDYLFGFCEQAFPVDVSVKAFITIGSPIPIFTAAMGYPESNVALPANVEQWTNILDAEDAIARYCAPHFSQGIVEDLTVRGKILPIKAHSGYWRSAEVAKIIAGIV